MKTVQEMKAEFDAQQVAIYYWKCQWKHPENGRWTKRYCDLSRVDDNVEELSAYYHGHVRVGLDSFPTDNSVTGEELDKSWNGNDYSIR